jgi:hypothetical protein
MPRVPCSHEDSCYRLAVAGGKPFCIAHGGGKRCQQEECIKSAVAGEWSCLSTAGGSHCWVPGWACGHARQPSQTPSRGSRA